MKHLTLATSSIDLIKGYEMSVDFSADKIFWLIIPPIQCYAKSPSFPSADKSADNSQPLDLTIKVKISNIIYLYESNQIKLLRKFRRTCFHGHG